MLFAIVVDDGAKNAMKRLIKQIFYADNLVLMGQTRRELRENFDEQRKSSESKEISVNLGKTKLMVCGMRKKRSTIRLIFLVFVEQ